MKTTIDIPDDLYVTVKKRAAELHKPLREMVIEGLRLRLNRSVNAGESESGKKIKWVVHKGGLPEGLDLSNREQMTDWLGSSL